MLLSIDHSCLEEVYRSACKLLSSCIFCCFITYVRVTEEIFIKLTKSPHMFILSKFTWSCVLDITVLLLIVYGVYIMEWRHTCSSCSQNLIRTSVHSTYQLILILKPLSSKRSKTVFLQNQIKHQLTLKHYCFQYKACTVSRRQRFVDHTMSVSSLRLVCYQSRWLHQPKTVDILLLPKHYVTLTIGEPPGKIAMLVLSK